MPLWAPLAIIAASMATGMLISSAGEGLLNRWYFIFFIVSSIATTLFVAVHGLFFTVCAQPILFTVLTPVFSILAGKLSGHSDAVGIFSKTSLLASFFPVVQHFFALLWTVILSTIIAVVRIWLSQRHSSHSDAHHCVTTSRVRRETIQSQRNSSRSPRSRRSDERGSGGIYTHTEPTRRDSTRSVRPSRSQQARDYDVRRRRDEPEERSRRQGNRESYRHPSPDYVTPEPPPYPSRRFTPRTYRPEDNASTLPPRTTRPRHTRRG